MSRAYEAYFEVSGIATEEDLEKVAEAVQEHWDTDNDGWYLDTKPELSTGCDISPTGPRKDTKVAKSGYSQGNLYGGLSEEEFSTRVAIEVWKALGRYELVVVEMTYLEDLPRETHVRDYGVYNKMAETGVLNS
jgi:hypothetical protein